MHPSQPIFSTSSTFLGTNQIITPENIFFPQVTQITNAKELPSTSQAVCPLITPSECQKKFQFNIQRQAVDDEFWGKFKEKLDKKSFNALFDAFLLTSWEPKHLYKHNLGQLQENITKTKTDKKEDLVLYYDTLVEVFLYNNLKHKAVRLIHSIIDLGHLNSLLTDPKLTGKIEIIRRRDNRIDHINEDYDHIFDKVYSPYQVYLNKTDEQKVNADITVLKNAIHSLRSGAARYQAKIKDIQLMNKHLPLINQCLLNLHLHQKIFDKNSKSLLISPILFTDIALLREGEEVQPAKKRRLEEQPCTSGSLQCSEVEDIDLQYKMTMQNFYSSITLTKQKHLPENALAATSGTLEKVTQQIDHCMPTISVFDSEQTETNLTPDVNETKFISLLNKMIGRDTYFYYEINTYNDKNVIVTPEKYYYSLIMLSAVTGQILLLKMKILTAELIRAEIKNDKALRTNIRKKIREKFSSFMNNHLIYQKNIEISLDGRINENPIGMTIDQMKHKYISNCEKINVMNVFLSDAKQEYNKIIQHCNENTVLEYYFDFINSSTVTSKINHNYYLTHRRITQITQSILNIKSVSGLTQKQLAALKFQIDRPPVDDSFWQVLKNEELSESEFKCYYFRFILTSWRSSPNRVFELENMIRESRYNHLELQLRTHLVEKHFQEKLRYQAFYLIHHILQIIKKCENIKKLFLDDRIEMRKIQHQIETSLFKVRDNYQRTLKIHSDYLTTRKSFASVDVNKLFSEIKTCQHCIHSNTIVDTEDAKRHILLLNEIFEKCEFFSFTTLLEIIHGRINNDDKSCVTPTSASACEDHVAKELQFVPVSGVEESNVSDVQPSSTSQIQTDLLEMLPFSTDEMPPFNTQETQINSEMSPFNTLDMRIDSLEMPLFSTSETQLVGPFLSFEAARAQPLSSSEMLHTAISFPLPLASSQQVTDAAKGANVQALKPSIELEQEQISELQAPYLGEIDTLDFLNR